MKKICIVFLYMMASYLGNLNASDHYDCTHSHNEKSPFNFPARTETPENGLIFREVTENANILYEGVSFGHAWADINKDGCPDLFCSGHGHPRLYINNCDETFMEVDFDFYKKYDTLPDGSLIPFRNFDLHGVSFADVNHDGWLDMYVQMGGDMGKSEGKMNGLFINENGNLIVQSISDQYGLRDSLGRGRSTLWADYNNDDYIDAFITNFNRTEGDFVTSLYQYSPESNRFIQYENLGIPPADYYGASLIRSTDGKKNQIVTVGSVGTGISVYDPQTMPFKNVFRFGNWGSRDIAVGDFNGDAIQDIFVVSNVFGSEAALFDDTTLLVYLSAKKGLLPYELQNRVSFETQGEIKVESQIYPYMDETKKYWKIGSQGYQPDTEVFTLNPNQSKDQYVNTGCLLCLTNYIGYSPNVGRWQIYSSDPVGNLRTAIKITSSQPIKNIQTFNFDNNSLESGDRLLLAQPNGYYAVSQDFLLNDANRTSTVSVVAGDFDNDMDLDLILSCQGEAINRPNRYYENDGNGKFTLIHNFGAEGSKYGRSGAISSADFNDDGFLDVFVENGEGTINVEGQGLHFNDGPYQLFMNKGNDNNWVKINLTDTYSKGNKFANGSVVYCYAGGKKQIRLKGSENHSFVQNDPTLHFGLGKNEIIDSLEIIWPDGEETKYFNLAVNKTYDINNRIPPIPTGVKNIRNSSFVTYPNPTSDRFIIQFVEKDLNIDHIHVMDYKGAVVRATSQKVMNDVSISMGDLPAGPYLIQIALKDGRILQDRIHLVK